MGLKARDNEYVVTPLHWAALHGHLLCYSTCASRELTRRWVMRVTGHHCTEQHSMVTFLWCSISKGRSDGMM